jgi:hypothetical protein
MYDLYIVTVAQDCRRPLRAPDNSLIEFYGNLLSLQI